jgi:predicted amidohydrolase YtcJ
MSGLLVFRGGPVLTGDPARPRTDAVAVDGGRVVAVGAEARARAGRADRLVDLAGGCLVPGFRDGHVHPLGGGEVLLGPPIRGVAGLDELLERLGAWARAHPELPVVEAAGYDPTFAPGGRFDAAWLDRAVGDRPALVWSADHHAVWANSAALAAAGVDAATPDPPRGRVLRRGDGSPLGTLLEAAADLVTPLLPPPDPGRRRQELRRAMAELAAAGIVWVQDALVEPPDLARYLDAAARGELTCRVAAALHATPGGWRERRDAFAALRATASAAAAGAPAADALVRADTVKLFADGVIENGTAALLEPYLDAPGSRGIPNWPPEELAEAVAAVDADGFQVHLHAIGDAGVRAALDAVEHAAGVNGPRDRRPVIAHTQLVHPDDLPRFARLGVVANFEPLWARLDPVMAELTIPRLGPERAARQYPIGSLARSGARLSFGSDWPVSSVVPMEGLAVAVTRQTGEGDPPGGWLPAERVALAAALAAYTGGGAWQAFEEDSAGTIAVGKRADLALLGADPTTLDSAELAAVPVMGTWLAGVRVFGG